MSFVNHGLVISRFGPIFYLSSVVTKGIDKQEWEIKTIGSSEIKNIKCLERCMKYFEYEVSHNEPSSSSSSDKTACIADVSASNESESDSDEESSSEGQGTCCPYCCKELNKSKQQSRQNQLQK